MRKPSAFVTYAAAAALLLIPPAAAKKASGSGANKHTEIDFSESIQPGYQPVADDERGIWMQVDEFERDLKRSKFIIKDEPLNDYVYGVLCKTVGQEECADIRLYLVRQPYFNASMAPNGMMMVWSGLLLRAQNEAQLATVLGHEYGHYEKRHSLQSFRDIRKKTDALSWLSFIPYVGMVSSIALSGSVFSFNRNMEREADGLGFNYLAEAGYDPREAARIWKQLRDEQDATAAERKQKSRKDRNGGFFATHPSSKERMEKLTAMAEALGSEGQGRTAQAEYRAALQNWWPRLIDDQIKLNDFGATLFLLGQLSADGFTDDLHYAYGEVHRARAKAGDFVLAADHYKKAVVAGSKRPETYRGLGLALLRAGQKQEGQGYLKQYLKLAPDAPDAPMMKMMSGEI